MRSGNKIKIVDRHWNPNKFFDLFRVSWIEPIQQIPQISRLSLNLMEVDTYMSFSRVHCRNVNVNYSQSVIAMHNKVKIVHLIWSLLAMIAIFDRLVDAKRASFSVRYRSEYETPIKRINGRGFNTHIIEQGDLLVKKTCLCVSTKKCKPFHSVKLAE